MTIKQLSPSDATFYSMETPNNPYSMAIMWICDPGTAPNGNLDFEQITEFLKNRVMTIPEFQRQLLRAPMDVDFPYWIQTQDIDFDYHIRHLSLPNPGNWKKLKTLIGELNVRDMDHDRPPWEIYVIDGLNAIQGVSEDSFALVCRFHHAFVDGKAFIELTNGLMSDSPEIKLNKIKKIKKQAAPPNEFEMWAKTLPNLWNQSVQSLKASYTSAQKIWELLERLADQSRPKQVRAPRTRLTTIISKKRRWDSMTFDITDLQSIRSLAEGASLNDVLISVIAGGLRRYLEKHDDLPKSKSLISICPVSVRNDKEKDSGGNLVVPMFIGIGTHIADPAKRLACVQSRTAKGIPLAREVIKDLNKSLEQLRPAYMQNMQNIGKEKAKPKPLTQFNTVITNVPGIMGGTKYFCGAEIKSIHPVIHLVEGVGVTHVITGLGKSLSIGISADGSVMGDMGFYTRCLKASLNEHLKSVKANHQASEAKPKAKPKKA